MALLKDGLKELAIDASKYYGPFTARAVVNFDVSNETVSKEIIYDYALIKKCAAIVNQHLKYLDENKSKAIVFACNEIIEGRFDTEFVVNKYQGGAGTSTNMNLNEVIANIALEKMGRKKHEYKYCHPINDVNLHQSTNDTYPTAVKIACIRKIRALADVLASLQQAFQAKETQYGHVLKLGRTQLMDGVPILAGQMFSAYADVISRDRWRIYKVEERMRYINIGGTAIGTGINAPLKYAFKMLDLLQNKTNMGLARADNLIDNTQNLDAFTEVSSLLSVAATNITKIANDLRFLSSGPHAGIGEITLQKRQDGSTIMPGKVNPVILENTIQCAQKVLANDQYIRQLVSLGNLELNAFLPAIAETLIESLILMITSLQRFNDYAVKTLVVNKEKCLKNLERSNGLIAPLISDIGYDKAAKVVEKSNRTHTHIKDILVQEGYYSNAEIDALLKPLNITSPPQGGNKHVDE